MLGNHTHKIERIELRGERLLEGDDERVVIQGFGNVGFHTARMLDERNANIIAISERKLPQSSPISMLNGTNACAFSTLAVGWASVGALSEVSVTSAE